DLALRKEFEDAVISVADNGSGISPELLPHIFERFRQGASSPARQHGGLGIGLALVHHLVEMHRGTVTAESDGEDRRARFTARVPLLSRSLGSEQTLVSELSAQRNESLEFPVLNGLQVLVLEDNAEALELVAT